MNIARFSVHRPVLTIMVALIVMILGLQAFMRLPIDLMPDITYPTVSITTTYENAGPEEVEELITRPLEEALSAVPGVEELTSVSAEGTSQVRISFAWGTDLDAATNDVRDRLDRAIARLPDEASRPLLRKFDLASFPILILGASSSLDPLEMRRIIDDQIKYRIERIPGVAALDVHGGRDREIQVLVDVDKVQALGLAFDTLIQALQAANITLPAGTLARGDKEITIRIPGTYSDLEELADTVIARRHDTAILLREVAEIRDTYQKRRWIVRVDARPGVRLAVNKQSGQNTVEVARRVLAELERINTDLPQIHLTTIIDTSDYIRRAIRNVSIAIVLGGLLAVLVLLFFLRNLRSTIVIATAIPLSFVAAMMLMYFGGFTLNLLTLGGLALGIGMLVDNAIVVLENIYRRKEEGQDIKTAAVEGTREVSAAIVASTLTTLTVFLPLIFVQGMSGIMFKQMAYVVGFALLCSLLSALTLVPMLSALLLTSGTSPPGSTSPWHPARWIEKMLTALENTYRRILGWTLTHAKFVVASAAILLVGSVSLIPVVGVEFMPQADESEVRINAEADVGTRLEVTAALFETIEQRVLASVPELKSMITFIGGTGWRAAGANAGQIRISLVPVQQRDRSSEEIAAQLRRELATIPGLNVRVRAGQGLFIMRMGQTTTESVQLEVRGYDLAVADTLADELQTMLRSIDSITDVRVSRESGQPEAMLVIDRHKAADVKLSVSRIAHTLQTALSGTRAGYFREGGKEYRILVQLKNGDQLSYAELLDLTIPNSDGDLVALSNVVHLADETGPMLIERKNQERIVIVYGNISGRPLGSVLTDVQQALAQLPVPQGFEVLIGGDYEEQQKSFRELLLSLVLAIVLIYMVMASLYESLRDPLVVMFTIPFAAIGVIAMLLVTGTTFNVQSFIGCIMLSGIAVNNAILLVDQINLLIRETDQPLREAIMEAGRRRLRPILMTALTTMLALTPLAIGLGEGGEAQAPMARAVIGGLLTATAITLLLVPTVFSLLRFKSEKN